MTFSHDVLPWLLSLCTIVMTVAQGDKKLWSWGVGLLGQIGWFAYSIGTETWGFLPLNVILTFLYIRNWMKWSLAELDEQTTKDIARAA